MYVLLTDSPSILVYRSDGKTKCKRTIQGYTCVCGDGYVSSDNGKCVKLNQCTASEATLDPGCTCERCACHDLPGAASYQYVHSPCSMCIHIHRSLQYLRSHVFIQ